MNFLEKTQNLLSEIDTKFITIQKLINKNIDDLIELTGWRNHFVEVWKHILFQLNWPLPVSPTKKPTFLEKTFSFLTNKQKPKHQPWDPNPTKGMPEMSPVFYNNSKNLSFSFNPTLNTHQTIYGFNLSTFGNNWWTTIATGHYFIEPSETVILLRLIPYIDYFIDIGANIGFYSLMMSHEGINSIAFEPSPECLYSFKKSVATNNLKDKIQIHPAAIGEKKGKTILYCNYYDCGITIPRSPGMQTTKEIVVPVDTLDNIFAKNKNLLQKRVLLKIDIEGAELEALNGGESCLSSRNKPIILIEAAWHQNENYAYQAIIKKLHNFGYTVYSVLQAQHNQTLLEKITNLDSFEGSPTCDYLAIPSEDESIISVLNKPMDMRLFTNPDQLNSLNSFLQNTLLDLKKEINVRLNKLPKITPQVINDGCNGLKKNKEH
jgi:FkbM family methyltransferase